MLVPWRETYERPRECIKKQRDHFVNKGPYSQIYGFPSSYVQMWEFDHKEGWALKHWCFWTVLEKTLQNPLKCKEIKPISPKGNQPSLEGLILKLKLQYFGHLMWRADSWEKTLMLGKIEGRRRRGWQRMRWLEGITHPWLNGHESEQTLGDRKGQGSLACCSPWGCKELDTT